MRCGGRPPAPGRLSSFPNLPPLFCIAARNSSYFNWLRAASSSAAVLPLLVWLVPELLLLASPLLPLPRRPLPLLLLFRWPRLLLRADLVKRPPALPLVYAAAVLIALLDRVDDDDDDEELARRMASNAPPPPLPLPAIPSWLFFLNSCCCSCCTLGGD